MTILGVEKGMTVVDLGTGTGYFVPHLARTVGPSGKVLALDVEKPMVDYVENRVLEQEMKHVEARLVAYDDPQLDAESVDRLVTVNTWHHIQNRESYAEKLHDALKPGGAVAVVDYTVDSPHGPPKDHKLAPEKVVEELEAGGLSAQIVDEDLPRQYIVIGRKAAE
jgi:cyclopropane fatty-acyl-phospholipid synthase-like methyltransferase